jgi:hypothetical protein
MRYSRVLPLPLVLAAVVLLTGALTPSPASRPEPPPDAPDPKAGALLDEALAALAADRSGWLETKVWQKVQAGELGYEADGRYLAGPGGCFRLDLATHVGHTDGRLLLVSDGTVLWQALRIGGPEWTSVRKMKTADLEDGRDTVPAALPASTFKGLVPLLCDLRGTLNWVRRETVRRSRVDLVKLTGVWPAEVSSALAPGGAWPAGLPRQCRLYLDLHTLWPHRVEWWGPGASAGADGLLVEMEFRDPVRNQPPPPARRAAEFQFDPGSTPVTEASCRPREEDDSRE